VFSGFSSLCLQSPAWTTRHIRNMQHDKSVRKKKRNRLRDTDVSSCNTLKSDAALCCTTGCSRRSIQQAWNSFIRYVFPRSVPSPASLTFPHALGTGKSGPTFRRPAYCSKSNMHRRLRITRYTVDILNVSLFLQLLFTFLTLDLQLDPDNSRLIL